MAGNNLYRLRQVDADGNLSYSNTLLLQSFGHYQGGTVNPNPAKNLVTVVVNKGLVGTITTLCAVNGKVLQKLIIHGLSSLINMGGYAGGVYLLKFEDGTVIKIVTVY